MTLPFLSLTLLLPPPSSLLFPPSFLPENGSIFYKSSTSIMEGDLLFTTLILPTSPLPFLLFLWSVCIDRDGTHFRSMTASLLSFPFLLVSPSPSFPLLSLLFLSLSLPFSPLLLFQTRSSESNFSSFQKQLFARWIVSTTAGACHVTRATSGSRVLPNRGTDYVAERESTSLRSRNITFATTVVYFTHPLSPSPLSPLLLTFFFCVSESLLI